MLQNQTPTSQLRKGPRRPRKANNLVYLDRHQGYRFTDPDALLEQIRNIINDSQTSSLDIYEAIIDNTNNAEVVNLQTIENLMNGKTKKPHNRTVVLVAGALGHEVRLVAKY